MTLSELIQPDLIKLDLEARDKPAAIEELVDFLIGSHELRLNDRHEVIEAVLAREHSLSTGMEHGLAVPHGTVSCVNELLVAIGISRKGIPFDSTDGKPARIVVLLVIPEGAFQRHVRTLTGIVRLASNHDLRDRILNAATTDEVMEVIYEFEGCEESGEGDCWQE
jgi:mannitol/fructose-specific phosphotransferase system IIA component (Ntr-type)